MTQPNYFCETLKHLRQHEEALLFINLLQFSEKEQSEAIEFLRNEYHRESLNFPYQVPAFDQAAALWAAKTFYIILQLLLYRENKEADIDLLLPPYTGNMNPGAVLSADLTLRFLPDILLQLKAIDPADHLVTLAENHLRQWHYSSIHYTLPANSLDFTPLQLSQCLNQLYIDRVILYKNISLAFHPAVCTGVKATLGFYAPQLWSDFNQERILENETH